MIREWHKTFDQRARTIKSASELGEDRSCKTSFIILGCIVYKHTLSTDERNIVDKEQQKKIINYLQTASLIKDTIYIVRMVDPTTTHVFGLINSFHNVTIYHKKSNEELGAYISCFRSLAAIYLENVIATRSSQNGKVFAIHLLNNSTLNENTLNNEEIQVVEMSKARASLSFTDRVVTVCTSKSEELNIILGNKPEAPSQQARGGSLTAYTQTCEDLFERI